VVKIGKNAGLFFGAIVLVGFGVVAIGFLETPFPDIIPLSLILERECFVNVLGFGQVSFGDLECTLRISSLTDRVLPLTRPLTLVGVDTDSPMTLEWTWVSSSQGNLACDATVTDPTVTLTDETGSIISTPPKGITEIQPLLLPDQQTLNILVEGNFDPVICQQGDVRYNGELTLRFLQDPPEIQEFTNPLLAQWLYLADFRDQSRVETSQRFAVAESFQLVDPTVITSLRVRIGSDLNIGEQDFGTSITAFVWNLDESPPKRIVQSAETFTGFQASRPEVDIDFTFPNAVALLPVENNQQITYGVGIRVEQNIGQKFIYMQSNQTADTHECVIARNSASDSESSFISNALCGFDIFHSHFKASQILDTGDEGVSQVIILDRLTEIENLIESTDDPITRAELVALLCEGIEPEPQICQGINTASPTADQCGVTEIFFNGQCLCAPTFDRNAQGSCEISDKSTLPDLLQIGGLSFLALVVIGVIIILVGITGIIVRRRR